MRMRRKSLVYSRFRVKKKTCMTKGEREGGGGCDRTLLVRTYQTILTLRVHGIMDVDYHTDRPLFLL